MDNFRIFIIFSISILMVITAAGLPLSFGAGIIYEPNGLVLRNNPTICSINPIDSDLSNNELEKFEDQSRISVQEWQHHLKSELRRNEFPNWDLTYKQLDYENLESNSILNCDIVLIFSKFPPSFDFWGALGIMFPDYQTGKSVIEIYYSVPQMCDSGERVKDPRENIIWIIQVPCYGEMMTSNQLGSVIRHELGHSFGLGHYMSADENETIQWNKGLNPAPSIMVEISYENTNEMKIVPIDIEMMQGIYGDDGFFLNTEEQKNILLEDPNPIKQNYTEFENSEYGFDLKHPEQWKINDPQINFGDYNQVLHLSEDKGNLNRTLTVGYTNKSLFSGSTDKTILEEITLNEENYCNNRTIEDNDFECENFALWDSSVKEDDNKRVYSLKYIWNDGSKYHVTFQNNIFDGNKIWKVTGEGILAPFFLTQSVMSETINSFKLDDFGLQDEIITIPEKEQNHIDPPSLELDVSTSNKIEIPEWIRNNAKWWAQGGIGDSDFVSGIQFLIKEGIIIIPQTQTHKQNDSQEIPSWIKNNADWWSQGYISDDDFVKGIQYLVEKGIIVI